MKKFVYVLMAAAAILAVSCKKDKDPENGGEETTQREVNEAMAGATSWGIIGTATAGGWDADTDLAKVSDNPEKWEIKGLGLSDGKFKFRGNDTWGDYDLGGGAVELGKEIDVTKGGGDMDITAGTYDITLYPTLMYFVIEAK